MIKLWEGVLHYLDEKGPALLALIGAIRQQFNLAPSFTFSCGDSQRGMLVFITI